MKYQKPHRSAAQHETIREIDANRSHAKGRVLYRLTPKRRPFPVSKKASVLRKQKAKITLAKINFGENK
jgi:hypothetical protein